MAPAKTIDRTAISVADDGFRPYDRYGKVTAGMTWKPLRDDLEIGTGLW